MLSRVYCYRNCLLALLVFTTSCSFDFSDIPEGAQITCGSSEDCPTGWTCVEATGRCVKAENLTEQPVTGNETITVYGKDQGETKDQAAEGDFIRVRFDVAQELDIEKTEVKLDLDRLENEEWNQDDNGFHYTYKIAAAASMGNGRREVLVSAVNKFGNMYRKVVGAATLNFHQPEMVGDITLVVDRPASCPISGSAVDRASFGTTVTISFWASEELLGGKPSGATLKLDQGGQNREFPLPEPQVYDLFFIYKFTLPADVTLEDGEYKLFVTLEDLAKNKNDVAEKTPGSGLNFKFSRPSAPDVDTADKLVYKRKPWGTKETGAAKTFVVTAGDEAVDDGTAWVLAYDGPDASTELEIGRARIQDRTFNTSESDTRSMKLSAADRIEIYVAAFDAACNRSDLVRVRDTEWTATMGYKVPGSTIENPHKFISAGIILDSTVQDQYATEPEVFNGSGFMLVSQGGQQGWKERTPSDRFPPTRDLHAIAYDSQHKRVVLFGGIGSDGNLNDTWEWDGANWVEKTPWSGQSPYRRGEHAVAYDTARKKLVMYGGISSEISDDTWEWDGASWEYKSTSSEPFTKGGHAMAYDGARGRVVLFGGRDPLFAEYADTTWEWDGTNWTQKAPASKPPGLSSHAMAFDSALGQVVLFGGRDYEGNFYNSTWVWDGTNWTKKSPATSPPPMYLHAMAYDSSRGKLVLFGGMDSGDNPLNDTWEWDGANWEKKSPVARPSMGLGPMLAYDSARKKVVMYGGSSFDDTWEWDGTNWTRKVPSSSPPKRDYHAVAWDGEGGKMVLFGGRDAQKGVFGETWEWDGSTWLRDLPANSPDGRDWHAMAYDSARKKVVLFGGSDSSLNNLGDTWEWDGSDWMKLSPSASPPARWGHALAYHTGSGKVVLFGGVNSIGEMLDETWEWDGSKWEKKTPVTSPIAKYKHSMAYDSVRERVVLFGGMDGLGLIHDNSTWEWDGEDWEEIPPLLDEEPEPPKGRQGHALSYDDARGKVVMFGGYDDYDSKDFNETWEWDGETWLIRSLASSPPARQGHTLAFDGKARRTVLFGGRGSTGVLNDTWEWDGQGDGFAGQQIDVEVTAAGYQKNYPNAAIKKVAATFISGGVGYPEGARKYGVDLLAWYSGGWSKVASNSNGPKERGPVEWIAANAGEIKKLNTGGGQKYHFAVVPSAPNGFGDPNCVDAANNDCDMGQVATEYVEVTVKYALP